MPINLDDEDDYDEDQDDDDDDDQDDDDDRRLEEDRGVRYVRHRHVDRGLGDVVGAVVEDEHVALDRLSERRHIRAWIRGVATWVMVAAVDRHIYSWLLVSKLSASSRSTTSSLVVGSDDRCAIVAR